MKKGITVITAVGIAAVACAQVNVIPMPQKVIEGEGRLECAGELPAIEETVDPAIPPEGYRLSVSGAGVKVSASDKAGFYYARVTLRQLKTGGAIPYVEIEDAPRFKWRGAHWDDCRHFLGKEALKRTLDAMAFHKLNTLHWHLTEDQGWRIEIKKYPELTKRGAVRPSSPKRAKDRKPDDETLGSYWATDKTPYGPYFYTQDDIREIVSYAAERNITVVPEIELPGHARAAIAAYPYLGCSGAQIEPWWHWGVSDTIFCGGDDRVVKFLEDVLDEVCELFPGPYIHIGGDEAPKSEWKKCAKCQARIKALGLAGEEGLQGWMTDHFTGYLAKKGKRAVGWDEVLDGNPGKGTVIMSWRGPGGGINAAARGNDAVMTPVDPCYLDNPQGIAGDDHEYINYGFVDTLERCYKFNPTAGINAEQSHHILGAQANNWTEYTFDAKDCEWKMWPRLSALAECFWTNLERKDYASFLERIASLRSRLTDEFGLNCAPLR